MIAVLHIPRLRLQSVLPEAVKAEFAQNSSRGFRVPGGFLALVSADQQEILEACDSAMEAGVCAGMSTLRARIQCPELQIYTLNKEAHIAQQKRVLDLLNNLSPRWQEISTDLFAVDLDWLHKGICLKLAKKSGLWLLRQVCQVQGMVASLCLGSKILAVRLAVMETQLFHVRTLQTAQELEIIHAQPVEICPLGVKTLEKLHALGLHTIKDISRLNRTDLISLFGLEGQKLWLTLQGGSKAQIALAEIPKEFVYQKVLETSLQPKSWLYTCIKEGIHELCASTAKEGLGFYRVRISLFLERSQTEQILDLRLPSLGYDLAFFERILGQKFMQTPISDAVSILKIELLELAPWQFQQSSLRSFQRTRSTSMAIQTLVERLAKRGFTVYRVVEEEAEHRLPERRAYLLSWDSRNLRRPLCRPRKINIQEDELHKPCILHINHRSYAVTRVLRFWKVCEDWWTPEPVDRTYFRLQLSNGAILKVFRDNCNSGWFQQAG